ncbi:MAG: bifunctional 3-deoxy-7-phosphoheptulonate synthase/chorismate mutase type II, partial [Bacteroidales bacterium]|nr:bifunctional 3-deoxy-7-phosphoheptulonate synthase/chorismate mutase type II [Bacteroidales bacterium]
AGCRSLLAEVAQQALHLDFDGLMLEVHPAPDCALSDAAQQITPEEFGRLLSGLRFPSVPAADGSLQRFRTQLDELDAEMLALLARRMRVSREIALVKAEKGLPLLQMERWKEVLADAVRQGGQLGLDTRFVESLMQLVHAASLEAQENALRHSAGHSAGTDGGPQSDVSSGAQKER